MNWISIILGTFLSNEEELPKEEQVCDVQP